MFTHTITRSYRDSSATAIQGSETATADTELNFDGPVVHSTTNLQIHWGCTVANLKSISISADKALTIKTNSSTTPQETINIPAGYNLIWTLASDGSGKVPFAGDVSSLFVTNAGSTVADDATLKIRGLAHQGA